MEPVPHRSEPTQTQRHTREAKDRKPTADDELALVLHGGGLVARHAGVVAVVQQREVGDAQGAGELDVVDGDTQAGGDGPAVLLPGDEDGLVAGHHHAGDEHTLADGEARELEGVDGGRDCDGGGGDVVEVGYSASCATTGDSRPFKYTSMILV